jgi:hypothetical protein
LRKLGIQAVCLDLSFDDETNDFSVFSWRTLIPIAERYFSYLFSCNENLQHLSIIVWLCLK